jgi:hypothetical protein
LTQGAALGLQLAERFGAKRLLHEVKLPGDQFEIPFHSTH